MRWNRKHLVFGMCVAFVLFSFSAFAGVASAKTIYVPDSYAKIQWAVDNASAGDTIIVRDGTYTENINVNKPHLTIRSENGADKTVVQAENTYDNAFKITANYVNISGFTVKGTKAVYPDYFAGIYLASSADHCYISHNNVSNNRYGIFLKSSTNVITDNKILDNDIGIYLYSSSNNNIIKNTVNSNGEGILVGASHYNSIFENIITDCGIGIKFAIFMVYLTLIIMVSLTI